MNREDGIPWVVVMALAVTAAFAQPAHNALGSLKCALGVCETLVNVPQQMIPVPKLRETHISSPTLKRQMIKKYAMKLMTKHSSMASISYRLKRLSYSQWSNWVTLDAGMYIYQGAQFTLKNRAKVMVRDGVINVVEL